MRKPSRAIALVLFLGTLAVFWPLGDAGFVNYDDPGYVYENAEVLAGLRPDGVLWAFTTYHKANYHPLSWLSHMGDVTLFGADPGAHHLVAVGFHALNVVLLFAFLVRATGAHWPSAFAAGLFAFHPLHVESVAWISERKDVLSTLFSLLALHGYVSWARFGGGLRYVGVLILLAAGLLSKPSVVTLPCLFLLLDAWPLRRVSWFRDDAGSAPPVSPLRLVAEKLPMFALVALASWATLQAQGAGGALVGTPDLPVVVRLESSAIAYVWYLEKMLWPAGLAVMYPHPYLGAGTAPSTFQWGAALALLLLLTGVALAEARRRPFLLVGWLWFLGTLVPMIGLVQVGAQATADRYSYVSLIGLFIVVAWSGAEFAAGSGRRRATVAIAASVILLACVGVTRAQLPHWRSAQALAERSVAVTRNNFVMRFNLGLALQEDGDLEGAARNYRRAIEIDPKRAGFHLNLATVLAAQGDAGGAIGAYRRAIELAPKDPGAPNNLAWLLATHPDASIRDGAAAVRLAHRAVAASDGADPQILDTLAAAQAELGDYPAAAETAKWAARLAREQRDEELAAVIDARGRAYAAGRPHRETGPPAP